MAKCVVCTTINAEAESKRHPNPSTSGVHASLQKRQQSLSVKDNPHKFCRAHAKGGTGRPTIKELEATCRQLTAQDVAEAEAADRAKEILATV